MKGFYPEKILNIYHWNKTLFSFKTTRERTLHFKNGQFLMIGIFINKNLIIRAYSIVSPNYINYFEFLSIKVINGKLTSILQNIKIGDIIFISNKPTGTIVIDNLHNGRYLYMFSTGTGIAPFISLIQDHELYYRFDKIILIHGTRYINDLVYNYFIKKELPQNKYIGKKLIKNLIYYTTVTREKYLNIGRITEHINSGKLFQDIAIPIINPKYDIAMICGSPNMIKEITNILNYKGFKSSIGDYVIERAFI
ncbi:Ferredoxin--NADP reductase [Candidatus Johnevansia muelleri]|uniref:ferredoxin--NADP(+) reductase n=1 Tax=Candidatus Johnevansia muelleri TaxID=1495769 RepID=A0A078KBK6_9GAMM|nr:Ferredoxin--NADP reductase [Candidatus Evansia muelleri]